MPSNKEFAHEVDELAMTITGYQEGKSGQNGLCDCIGLIMGAMTRLGRGSYPIHSTNYFARYQTDNLAPIVSASQLQLGEMVYKITDDVSDLNDRYKYGGRYYTGDLTDYYHVGVVTAVNPLEITHCTQSQNANGIVRENTVKQWDWRGMVRGVDYGVGPISKEEEKMQGVVTSSDGNPVKLRPSPSTSKPYISKVPVGTVVTINEGADGWSQVNLPSGQVGYMMTQFLAPVGEPEEPSQDAQQGTPKEDFEEQVILLLNRIAEAVERISGGAGL